MQNDKFKVQTVANTRQIVPAKKAKKNPNLLKKILKQFHTHTLWVYFLFDLFVPTYFGHVWIHGDWPSFLYGIFGGGWGLETILCFNGAPIRSHVHMGIPLADFMEVDIFPIISNEKVSKNINTPTA